MELSLVLWNCNGNRGEAINGNRKPPKATVAERQEVFKSTYTSWQQGDMIPTVILAQELYSGGLTSTWTELSKKSNSSGKCEAACFFLEFLGKKNIKFLDSGDLQRIIDSILPPSDRYDDGIARIHCSTVTLGLEKILICSWHGKYKGTDVDIKKLLLRKMLIFVNKVKEDQNCVAALVGGDFNLDSVKTRLAIPQSVENAFLYDEYQNPSRNNKIDYVIAWPENRFILSSCGVIETDSQEASDVNPKIFDHALIRYDFRVMVKWEWKGEGEVKWCGKCGEGEVTLTGNENGGNFVTVREVSGKWKGRGTCSCIRFDKLEIKRDVFLLEVDRGDGNGLSPLAEGEKLILTNEMCEYVVWRGSGLVKWEGAETKCVFIGDKNGKQTVKWNGTGRVEWVGEGKATWLGGKLVEWNGKEIKQ